MARRTHLPWPYGAGGFVGALCGTGDYHEEDGRPAPLIADSIEQADCKRCLQRIEDRKERRAVERHLERGAYRRTESRNRRTEGRSVQRGPERVVAPREQRPSLLKRLIAELFGGGQPPQTTVQMTVKECGSGDFVQEVAGESHCQPAIRAAAAAVGHELGADEDGAVSFEVILIREPDNRHDRYAVKVCDVEQRHLGYIPRELAAQLASQLDNLQRRGIIASCNAKVWGKDRNYGIWLDLDLTELLNP